MIAQGPDITDLKHEILQLKKQFRSAMTENSILKVKVRRMQEELLRKNRQLQVLLDPQRASNRKINAEQGASLIFKLRDQVEDLNAQLQVKDFQIKKLQNQVLSRRVYDKNSTMKHVMNENSKKELSRFDDALKDQNRLSVYMNYKELAQSPSPISEFSNAIDLLQENISKIKQQNYGGRDSADIKSSNKDTIFSATPNYSDGRLSMSPHGELHDLSSYVMQMTLELDNLKTNFMQMQRSNRSIRSKSADPRSRVKTLQPKLIIVQPSSSKDSKNSTETDSRSKQDIENRENHGHNGSVTITNAFGIEETRKKRTNGINTKKNMETYQQTSDCSVLEFVDECDSVSEIILPTN